MTFFDLKTKKADYQARKLLQQYLEKPYYQASLLKYSL
jgi:hypothetical protein